MKNTCCQKCTVCVVLVYVDIGSVPQFLILSIFLALAYKFFFFEFIVWRDNAFVEKELFLLNRIITTRPRSRWIVKQVQFWCVNFRRLAFAHSCCLKFRMILFRCVCVSPSWHGVRVSLRSPTHLGNQTSVSHVSSQMDRTHLLQKSPDHNGVEADDDQKWEKVAKDKEANLEKYLFTLFQTNKLARIETATLWSRPYFT